MTRCDCGGEAGIRTLDTAFGPYNGLANRRLQPLGHLTAARFLSIRYGLSYGRPESHRIVPEIVPVSPEIRVITGVRRPLLDTRVQATVLFEGAFPGSS